VSNITKLSGGIKIVSPDKGDLVPLNSNSSLLINGVSKDNVTSDCDVSIIINNVKPYQNVKPTGVQGDNDYSNWQYTVSSNYTNINEGNNKITSKILCLDGPQTSQAYYSVNITATNFTQAQLSSYNMMLESSNSTINSGNMSQASSGSQPFAQIQQFNQDTGKGPICCNIAGSSPGQVSAATDTTNIPTTDATDVATTNDEEENNDDNDDNSNRNEEENNDDNDDNSNRNEEENNDDNDDNSNRNEEENNDDNNNDDNNNDDNNNDDNDGDSGRSIMDDVEDTIRDSGINFRFD
jgi:hypothetical protein